MKRFVTVRLLQVEGTPKNVDPEGVTQKIPGRWKKLGRWLIEDDEEALDAIDKEIKNCSEKA